MTSIEPSGQNHPQLRVSDQDRQTVADRLNVAFAEGRLTLEEFSERTAQAYSARTAADLEPLTKDLPAPASPMAVRALSDVPQTESSTTVAIMGGRGAKGRWRPARINRAIAIMGGVEYDLREAELVGPVIDIKIFAFMGGASIIVPEGVRVESSGFAFMGGRDEHIADVPSIPGTPVVRVRSVAVMGGVEIKSKPVKHRDR